MVEDESIVAMDICDGLASMGYEVIGTADRADDAIEKARTLKPDLVLMDIILKGPEDGIFAAQQIGTTLHTPVVFLTAHGDESTLQRAKLTDPYGYILKPFETEDLHTAVEIALHRFGLDKQHAKPGAPAQPAVPEEINYEFLGPDAAAKIKFLQEVRIFDGLGAGPLQKIASAATVRELDAGGFVFHAGSPVEEIIVVATGRIAVVRSSSSGKELIVDLIGPGEIVGLQAFTDSTDQNLSARAQTDSRVLALPVAAAHTLLSEHPELYPRVLNELGVRLRKSQELASSLAHAKVETRIASTLLALLPDFGKKGGVGGHQRIFLTRKELAELTGTTPETAIRTTKNLERSGILDLSRPGIIKILSEDELRALTE